MNRRTFLKLTATTVTGSLSVTANDAFAARPGRVVDAGPASKYAIEGVDGSFRDQGFFLVWFLRSSQSPSVSGSGLDFGAVLRSGSMDSLSSLLEAASEPRSPGMGAYPSNLGTRPGSLLFG